MADIGAITPGNIQPQRPAATPPPLPQTEAPPQAPTDRVVLQEANDGVRGYRHEKDASGVDYQTWTSKSGAKYEVATTQEGTRFHAELPAGLTQQPLEITGAWSKEGTAVVANPAGHPEQRVKAEMTPDGKIMVPLAPNGPMAMFDPNTMEFGLGTPGQPQMGPHGTPVTFQALQEVVHADGSHTVKANIAIEDKAGGWNWMTTTPTVPERQVSYLQVDDSNGQVTARQVTEHQPLGNQTGIMAQIGHVMKGPGKTETAVNVAKQGNGLYQVAGAGLMDQMKASLSNPFSLQSPVGNWLKGRNQQPTTVTTFTSNPFPLSAMGAVAGPAAAAAAAAPFPQPNVNAIPPPPQFPPRG